MSLIQVINPNTSLSMTETIGRAARAVAAPGTEILAVSPSQGVPSIEGHFDEAIAAIGVLKQIRLGREQGVSAAVKMVESLVALGFGTSKHGDFAYPLQKTLTGAFQHLN